MRESNKKKKSIFTVIVASLLLLVTGTFAWTSISQRALNEKEDLQKIAGGRVHDDYSKVSGNKDIYAENYGKTNLLVRIKLSEYFEGDNVPLVDKTLKEQKNTWTPYVTPHTAPSINYREFVTWTLGGEKVYLPTFNTNNEDLSADATGDAIDVNGLGGITAEGSGEQEAFSLGAKVPNPDNPTEVNVTQETLKENRAPISMAEWKTLPSSERRGSYWIIDEDGWAYWAELLAPDTATSLLLNDIQIKEHAIESYEKWYYGIDVIGEYVSPADRDKFATSEHGEPSSIADELISYLVEGEQFSYSIEFDDIVNEVQAGATTVLKAKVSKTSLLTGETTPATDVALEWSLDDEDTSFDKGNTGTATTISSNGELFVAPFEKNTNVKISVRGTGTNAISTHAITVNKMPVGTEFDFFGTPYLYLEDQGEGNKLIITKYTQGKIVMDSEKKLLDNVVEKTSTYYGTLSVKAQELVQPISYTLNRAKEGVQVDGNFVLDKVSEDVTLVDLENGTKTSFVLSAYEINRVSGEGKAFPDGEARSASEREGLSAHPWPTRTAWSAEQSNWFISYGSHLGVFSGGASYGFSQYMRPALIIKP